LPEVRGLFGRAKRCLLDGGTDRIQDALGVSEHVPTPDSDNRPAVGLQCGVSSPIAGRIGVLGAIDLDREPNRQTREVEDVALEWVLAPEPDTKSVPT
jgi:hypothetical protein